jgi:hypothetical protein
MSICIYFVEITTFLILTAACKDIEENDWLGALSQRRGGKTMC